MDIRIDIKNEIAINPDPNQIIVCGNSKYTATFNFDDSWMDEKVKTARFVYVDRGKPRHIDKVFTGSTVNIPILSEIDEVYIGVFAGNLQTTTPARVICKRSILCGSGSPSAPAPDVYAQIIEMMNKTSVTVTTTRIENGVIIKVSDINGVSEVMIYDGKDGESSTKMEAAIEDNILVIREVPRV